MMPTQHRMCACGHLLFMGDQLCHFLSHFVVREKRYLYRGNFFMSYNRVRVLFFILSSTCYYLSYINKIHNNVSCSVVYFILIKYIICCRRLIVLFNCLVIGSKIPRTNWFYTFYIFYILVLHIFQTNRTRHFTTKNCF